jgi:hypothetical protein
MRAAPDFRKRLARLCGMLGSDYEGERANAAALATKLIREQRLTWELVIAGPPATDARNESRTNQNSRGESGPSDLAKVQAALAHPEDLSEWEVEFLASILLQLRRHRRLSPRQESVLNRIYDKVTH